MDRKSIFKRALLEETPIDPTEDAGQMQLLLKHIRSAIDAEKGTRRQLIRNAKDPATLSLHLTTLLPGSLGDLQWIVHFESLQPASLRQHLISPLMSRVYNQKQQVNELVSQLNAKDHIISKLLDKLEGSGVEIASVFPGAAGARGSKHITSREQAARQVHGLGAFDYQEWQQSQNADKSLQLSQENLVEVLKISDFHEDADESKDAGFQWLAALPSTISEASSKDKDATPAPDTEGDVTMDEDVTAADEDIFEVRQMQILLGLY
ncbi:DNA double-strand break repair and VJ recombination XRCC4 [Botryosphaeria dothidea]|uniref:Non-homologous end-joining factor 1 n=1 Tax=Botryosphaeria dothidea TaxID=55169 RepID=A0A8H4NEX6_9PEZI|nr:DNA double-strand break repair and VJ recombination XRCC4 [Botryosphaeria dothidea]